MTSNQKLNNYKVEEEQSLFSMVFSPLKIIQVTLKINFLSNNSWSLDKGLLQRFKMHPHNKKK